MGLFTPKSYTTELSPKSLREVGDETAELQQTVKEDVVPFAGATVSENGKEGLVPAPTSDDKGKFLKGDGTWGTPSGGGGGGTSDYEDLSNKPAIDGNTLSKDTTAEDLGLAKSSDIPDISGLASKNEIPSKVSELQNDSGFISDFTETDPTVPSWAKAENKPSYSKSEVGLGNVDNTSDANKPVSIATAAALALKQDALTAGDGIQISGQNVISINPTFGFTPVGTVISVMGNAAPANYLACNGQTVNIADYPELANYFEAQFGTKNHFGGDGTTTFGIPDLRGEFLRGTGTNGHADQGNGANVGTHQDATSMNKFTGTTQYRLFGNLSSISFTQLNPDSQYGTATSKTFKLNGELFDEVSASSPYITTRPTNTSVLYCIATKNIYLNPALDYSTDEKVVGSWIDGKPIYQKTFTGTLSSNDSDISHGVSNIDLVTDAFGFAKWHDQGETNEYIAPDGFYNGTNRFSIMADTTKIYIRQSGFGNRDYIITLRYTKTTD